MLSAASCQFFAALFALLGTWHLSQGHEDCTELSQSAIGDALLQIGQRPLSKELPELERELEHLTGQELAEPAAKQIADAEAENDKNSTDRKNTSFTDMVGADDQKVKRDTTTLFYHFHIPKTGGTTVANLMMADVCTPWNLPYETAEHYSEALCNHTCPAGRTDNMLSCYPDRHMYEHGNFSGAIKRAQGLAGFLEADRVIYVTSLRRGSDRVVSQWAQEVQQGLFIPAAGIEPWSNESLAVYVSGGAHTGQRWIQGRSHVSQLNNLQVAELSSLPQWIASAKVTVDDLEMAKKVLMTGEWRIGFMKCMQQLHEGLSRDANSVHGFDHPGHERAMVIPHANEDGHGRKGTVFIDKKTQELVDSEAYFDNELYDWAWKLAEDGADGRFADTC